MDRKKENIFLPFAFSGLTYGAIKFNNVLQEQLKEQIKTELKAELREEILRELRSELRELHHSEHDWERVEQTKSPEIFSKISN